MILVNRMFDRALDARLHAYVPYSRFPVAACIAGAAGDLYVGVNVDNAAFPQTSCAEANAIGAMVAAGERRISSVLVLGGTTDDNLLCTPCGGCRQRLSEFADQSTTVHVCGPEGVRRSYDFFELLPHPFGPSNLPD